MDCDQLWLLRRFRTKRLKSNGRNNKTLQIRQPKRYTTYGGGNGPCRCTLVILGGEGGRPFLANICDFSVRAGGGQFVGNAQKAKRNREARRFRCMRARTIVARTSPRNPLVHFGAFPKMQIFCWFHCLLQSYLYLTI